MWFVDKHGDHNNLVYGTLYRTDVPLYYRQRFCLGLPRGEKITFNKSVRKCECLCVFNHSHMYPRTHTLARMYGTIYRTRYAREIHIQQDGIILYTPHSRVCERRLSARELDVFVYAY